MNDNIPIMNKRSCYRYDGSVFIESIAEVASEFALTVYVNHDEFATLVCTPSSLEDLIIGFLASEGIIRDYEEIESLIIDSDKGFAYVNLLDQAEINTAMFTKRRVTSCCGKGRISYYYASDAGIVRPIESSLRMLPKQVLDHMSELILSSETHRITGGVHNAGLCGAAGLLLSAFDIGRHNALDKIYGACLRDRVPTLDKSLIISGRISSEMVLKTAKIGCPLLLSKSAPTDLAIRLADELGITLVGFIRGNAFNVYTHPDRVNAINIT